MSRRSPPPIQPELEQNSQFHLAVPSLRLGDVKSDSSSLESGGALSQRAVFTSSDKNLDPSKELSVEELQGYSYEERVLYQNNRLLYLNFRDVFDENGNLLEERDEFGESVARLFSENHGLPSYEITEIEFILDDCHYNLSSPDYDKAILWTQNYLTEGFSLFFEDATTPTLPKWITSLLPFDFKAMEKEEIELRKKIKIRLKELDIKSEEENVEDSEIIALKQKADELANRINQTITIIFANFVLALSLKVSDYFSEMINEEARRRNWAFSDYMKSTIHFYHDDQKRFKEVFHWYRTTLRNEKYINDYRQWTESDNYHDKFIGGMIKFDSDNPNSILSVFQDEILGIFKYNVDAARELRENLKVVRKKYQEIRKSEKIIYARKILIEMLPMLWELDKEAYFSISVYAFSKKLFVTPTVSASIGQSAQQFSTSVLKRNDLFCSESTEEEKVTVLKEQDASFFKHRCEVFDSMYSKDRSDQSSLSSAEKMVKLCRDANLKPPPLCTEKLLILRLYEANEKYLKKLGADSYSSYAEYQKSCGFQFSVKFYKRERDNVRNAFQIREILAQTKEPGVTKADLDAAILLIGREKDRALERGIGRSHLGRDLKQVMEGIPVGQSLPDDIYSSQIGRKYIEPYDHPLYVVLTRLENKIVMVGKDESFFGRKVTKINELLKIRKLDEAADGLADLCSYVIIKILENKVIMSGEDRSDFDKKVEEINKRLERKELDTVADDLISLCFMVSEKLSSKKLFDADQKDEIKQLMKEIVVSVFNRKYRKAKTLDDVNEIRKYLSKAADEETKELGLESEIKKLDELQAHLAGKNAGDEKSDLQLNLLGIPSPPLLLSGQTTDRRQPTDSSGEDSSPQDGSSQSSSGPPLSQGSQRPKSASPTLFVQDPPALKIVIDPVANSSSSVDDPSSAPAVSFSSKK